MLIVTDVENKLGAAIDRALKYYALFRFPLQAPEIRHSCQMACTEDEVSRYLVQQEALGKIFSAGGYYAPSPDVAVLVERRLRGAEKAARDIERARRCGRLIYQFPFVRFVGISGSLSKGFSDQKADFDFFIVTQKDRLWISRTLLHLFKKMTFAFGLQHRFCMNYFIDEAALLLDERNIYTATELSSLLPVCGSDTYRRFMQANAWVRQALPNHTPGKPGPIHDRNGPVKQMLSAVIGLMHPAGLNRFFMWLTDTKWRRKWARKGYPAEDYDLAFKTTPHVSKNHPANYQKKILEELR
jgi:hypothetical protein